jgi:hypothetical protein
MNDYMKMRKYLESLNDSAFSELLVKLGYDILIDGHQVIEIEMKSNGTRSLPSDWKAFRAEELLAYRENKKAEWNRLCSLVKIDMDAARQIKMTWFANITSILALLVSIIALIVSAKK